MLQHGCLCPRRPCPLGAAMNIEVRWVGNYADVTVCTENATLQLGLQSAAERIELIEHLRYVAERLEDYG
jgi:hypothetical protein